MGSINAPEAKITELLHQVRGGDEGARQELLEVVYAELHRIAAAYLRKERANHTLQATALVNEAYVRVFGGAEIQFANRAHFFAVGARAMRRVLVDHARARMAGRRVPEGLTVALDGFVEVAEEQMDPEALVELDRALDALGKEKEGLAQLVEMRYFGGMTAEESAEALGRTAEAVRHELRFAHAWLRRYLAGAGG